MNLKVRSTVQFALPHFNALLLNAGFLDQSYPYVLTFDWMEMRMPRQAIRIFEYLEERMTFVKKDLSPNKSKGLLLLRTGNEMLKRLSRHEDALACGKILLFQSRLFPLCTRSGVNVGGSFNVENVTDYEPEVAAGAASETDSATATANASEQYQPGTLF